VTRTLILGATLTLAVGFLPAAAPTRRAVESDQLDYVYLASDRPVRLRLHLLVGDRPYSASWHDYLNRLFAHLDTNKDGFLDAREALRVPNYNYLNSALQGSIGFPFQGQNAPLAQLDTDKDGKVTLA